jgi:pentatricopeptide repeat protein
MIDVYSSTDQIEEVMKIFKASLKFETPDLHMFTATINALGQNRRIDDLIYVLNIIKEKNIKPDQVTLTSMMNAFIRNKCLDQAVSIFNQITKPNLKTVNTLINGYIKAGDIPSAMIIIKEMPKKYNLKPDLFSYSTVISGLCHTGRIDKAEMLYEGLVNNTDQTLRPSQYIYSSMIHAFTKNHRIDKASKIFNDMKKAGEQPDQAVYTAYILGLIDAGKLTEAEVITKEMKKELKNNIEKRIITQIYERLIEGYIKLKKKDQAKKIFDNMRLENLSSLYAMKFMTQ